MIAILWLDQNDIIIFMPTRSLKAAFWLAMPGTRRTWMTSYPDCPPCKLFSSHMSTSQGQHVFYLHDMNDAFSDSNSQPVGLGRSSQSKHMICREGTFMYRIASVTVNYRQGWTWHAGLRIRP